MHFFFYHFEKFYINGYNLTIAPGVDEPRINFKHLLGCGAFFCQIGRKQCIFQKWFYNWSCTLKLNCGVIFLKIGFVVVFFLTAAPRHG